MPYFYNITATNSTDQPIPMIFNQQLKMDLIPNGKLSDYDVGVVQVVLSNQSTPLMEGLDKSPALTITVAYQPSPSDPVYYGTGNLVYNPTVTGVTDGTVSQFDQFIIMLNQTVADAWTNLLTSISPPTPPVYVSAYPFFTYDASNQLMTLFANFYYLSDNPIGSRINMYVNRPLQTILQGFNMIPVGTPSGSYQFYILYNEINPVVAPGHNLNEYLFPSIQSGLTFDSIIPFNLVTIQTNLPIQTEMSDQNTQVPIIIDFVPNLNMYNYRDDLVWSPITPYRQYSIQSSVQYIQFYVYRSRIGGPLTQMILGAGQSSTLKLMLTEKSRNKFA